MAKKGLIFISKTSFSGATSVNVDSVFSASYTHYLIRRNLSGSIATTSVQMRMRVSGADDTGSNYRDQYVTASSTSVSSARTTAVTSWSAGLGDTEATSIGFQDTWVSNPFDAARTTGWTDYSQAATGNIAIVARVWAHDLTTSYTGFTLFVTAGTITGSVSVFGLVKS